MQVHRKIMAAPPPRPSMQGGPGSSGPSSASGTRQKEPEKPAGTFFLGRYRVVDEIGVGGMASVHLARMDGPGGFQKWVAIKRIHPHLVEDDQFVDMFLDEARIAAGINHANVAQVFDLGKDDNTYWIAMEYLHGEPLREVMRRVEERGQRVPVQLAARICADAADGLHAAHELRGKNGQLLGLVHRDVTPHNLFVTYDGYTKVVDFGIAKVADRLSQTKAGTLKGKLAYMSPEQVRGAEVDRTTDVFALGVVLWELTTNQRLFRMETDLDTLEKVQACIVPPPSTIIPGYPPELESVVLRALAKKKQDRYQTAREFSRALQGFLMRQGAMVGPEEVSQYVRAVFGDRIQKREAHLAWAAEVTSTINVEKLRAMQGGDEPSAVSLSHASAVSAAQPPPPPASQIRGAAPPGPPPKPQSAMAATSLLDDDEDIPTTVATRDQLEPSRAGAALAERAKPVPAAGMPAPPPPRQTQQSLGAPPPPPRGPGGPPSFGCPSPPQYGQNQPYAPPPPPHAMPAQQDSTSAFPGLASGGHDDLNATIALPQSVSNAVRGAPAPAAGLNPPSSVNIGGPMGPPSFGGPPSGQPMNGPPGYPGQGPMQYGAPPSFGPPGAPMYPPQPQSQIETAISLPRPDPAAIWLAQQEAQRGKERSSGVIIAVVALAALCVIGVTALLYFKFRSESGSAPDVAPTSTAVAAVSQAPSASAPPPGATQPSTTSSGAAASTSATAAASATAGSAAGTGTSSTTAAAAPPPAKEIGFLTLGCDPRCDQVLIAGRSFVPPIVREPFAPGSLRVTAKLGGMTKVISVVIVAGQTSSQKISMKK
ncbi:MAG: protein kinase [Polyangiaceae bacterium]|nr:protein kinase [Polyangiaceae bacterium]